MQMRDRFGAVRAGVCALVAAAVCAPVMAQVSRGPTPGGDPAPAPRGVGQPSIEVRPDGTIVEMNTQIVMPTMGIPMTGIWEAGTTTDDPSRVIPRPMAWDGDSTVPAPPLGFVVPTPADYGSGDNETRFTPLFQNFDALGPNGLDPPDPDLAAGPDHIVQVTNDDFAIYDKCGNELFRRDINDFLGTTNFLFDPKVIYDPWNNRWVMMWHERDFPTETGRLRLVISSTGTPWGLGSWFVYNFNVVQNAGTADASWPDYFDLGYQQDFINASGNMFEFPDINGNRPFRWARHIIWDKSQIYNALAASFVSFSNLDNPDGSRTFGPRACQSQWQFGGLDGVFLNSRPGGGSRITIWKLTDAFGANTLTSADITVDSYSAPPDAVQPNGQALDTIDARLMPCVLTNDIFNGNGLEIFTALTTGNASGTSDARLFKFDASSNAVELDRNFFASGWSYWFATPAADFAGNGYWVFCRSGAGAGQEAEVRFVDMNRGSFTNTSNQMVDGTGSRTGCGTGSCRWGDYFGAQIDWGDYNNNFSDPERPMRAWMVGEYGVPGSWATHIGSTSVFSQGNIASVTPSTTFAISGNEGTVGASSRVYTMTNSGQTGTRFTVSGLPTWLNASVEEGELYNGTRSVTLSVDTAVANGLCSGTYTAFVLFTDCSNGGNTFSRRVDLTIAGTDLSVASVDATDGVYFPGAPISVFTVFQNMGPVGLPSFDYEIRLSTNTIISTFDALMLETSSFVNGNSSINSPRSTSIPLGTAPGTYFVGIRANTSPGPCDGVVTGFDPVSITVVACEVDWNVDGSVNIFDIIAFLNDWNSNVPAANFNGDGAINIFDIIDFLNAWSNGCP